MQHVNAQHTAIHSKLLWFNYNNAVPLSRHWSILNDVQIRSRGWATHWAQFAVRTEGLYRFNQKIAVGAGFTWFGTARYVNDEMVLPNEWRPFEDALFELHGKKWGLLQRFRLEQRFLQKTSGTTKLSDYEHRERLRYRFEAILPHFSTLLELRIGNEVMVNVNYIEDNRFYDQNRTFIIVNYPLSHTTQFQFQYLKIFQWQAASKIMDNQDVLRFGIQQQFHLHQHKTQSTLPHD